MLSYLWIGLGGALGSMGRYWLGGLVSDRVGETFPWGTLTVNIAGSFIIGLLGALVSAEGRMDPQSRAFVTRFLMAGVCGGFTTFSSFSLQTMNLAQGGEWLRAGGNIIGSVTLCLVAVWLGHLAGTALNTLKGS